MNPLLSAGHKKPLTEDDYYKLLAEEETENLTEYFEA
jgi:hypothetical protein